MQVFDYQNSRNTAAKVIDYGHKSADAAAGNIQTGAGAGAGAGAIPAAGGLPKFRPVNTFDYGHASHNTPPQTLSLADPGGNAMNRNANVVGSANNKKKNKKKNKNRQRPQQQQQPQQQLDLQLLSSSEVSACFRRLAKSIALYLNSIYS